MASVQIRYGGSDASGTVCPSNYPPTAPQDQCGHESFVELDGQMAYKMAIAYHVTNDTRWGTRFGCWEVSYAINEAACAHSAQVAVQHQLTSTQRPCAVASV
eukprot:GHUV01056038.1.p1 GENE.GHUV01056038.1~~GHUV01056038.1.p1  ORF type:complete len:102 (+),score=2.77 GHUV01056038.1:212-517(+)